MHKNENQGVLFKGAKRADKNDPDYTGNITIDGKDYWLNAWINKSKDGSKTYMALKAKLKTGSKPERHEEGIPF